MKKILVIPARYASSRLPGKPLIDLMGKSMIQRVYEQCAKALNPKHIFVATDDDRILEHCDSFGCNVLMTSEDCLTGTDRVAEVSKMIDADYYINVQGDEPLFNPRDIHLITEKITAFPGEIINGYCDILEDSQFSSSSIPKVVMRPDGRLLYMSRAPIPSNKQGKFNMGWRQVCIYAFPKEALLSFSKESSKTPLEAEEDIEILRFLELGYEVRMIKLSAESIAIDTSEDVEKVLRRLHEIS
jgi:3-deoxy-manno-octulosonate cytidylyltransferase (CMP-KDO synthetase)